MFINTCTHTHTHTNTHIRRIAATNVPGNNLAAAVYETFLAL